MSRADRLALLLSLVAVLVTYFVTVRVFEALPHIEDEIAYVWQAQVIAEGHLTVPSPEHPKSFLVPFVVDYNGQRFGKYPLGWPALLAVGVFFGVRAWVNPVLAGWGVWLTYRLGKRVFSETVGLLAAGLTITSPFFLMNSGSLLSHPFGLLLSASFALAWLDAWEAESRKRSWLAIITAAASLGLLILARPFTALAISLPFMVHGLFLFVRRDGGIRRRMVIFGLIVLAMVSLHFLWQYAVTGDPFLNPYTLWWEYDKVGFGPGFGRTDAGHSLSQAWVNTRHSLMYGRYDLFGWGAYSWIFLPIGLLAIVRNRQWKALLLASVFPCLVVVYLAYWIGASLFGPRYFYEGLYSLTLLSAVGIAYLAGWPVGSGMSWPSFAGWRRARPLLVTALLALLLSVDVLFYAPLRLGSMHGLYSISRARLQPFLTSDAQAVTPALVIVHPDRWMEYGALLDLQDPFLDTPYIFVISRGRRADAAVIADFPERTPIHYYPDTPFVFYTVPSPTK